MADQQQDSNYSPVYPQQNDLPGPDVRTFVTNFYRISDRHDANELWVSSFTKDAEVTMGNAVAHGEQAIRELRGNMWSTVRQRRHRAIKAFPGQFQDSAVGDAMNTEVMLYGEVSQWIKGVASNSEEPVVIPWAAHLVVRKVDGEWKLAKYRVWLQK